MPRNPSLTQHKETPFMVSFLKSELGPVKLCLASCNEQNTADFYRKVYLLYWLTKGIITLENMAKKQLK
jgi:hypothetical protein